MGKKSSAIIYGTTMVLSKSLLQIIINKVVSISFGASGLGLFGQWQNLSQILFGYSNGAINNGVILKTALHKSDAPSLKKWVANALALSLLASIVIGIGTWVFSSEIENWFFPTFKIGPNLHLLAIVLPFSALSSTLLNIANGCRKPGVMSLINISASLMIAIFFFFGVRGHNLSQLMIAWSCIQIGLFGIHLIAAHILLNGSIWVIPKLDWDETIFFARHTLMAIVGSTAFPFCYLALRKSLTLKYGEEMAGYWEALQRFSNVSMAFFSAIMASFLLPKYVSVSYSQLFLQLKKVLCILLIPYATITVIVFFYGGDILECLYSESLRTAAPAFHWQTAGDYFRVSTFLLSNTFLSRSDFLRYASIELAGSFCFYILFSSLILSLPLVGAAQAYFLSSLVSFTMAISYLRYKSRFTHH